MKKLFSLVCAAVVALSASAFAPVKLNPELAVPAHKSFVKPAMDANIQKQANFASAKNVKPGHRVAAATQDYTPVAPANAQAGSWNSYYGDGSWMVQFFDAAGNFCGDLELLGPSTGNTIAGTYTTEEYCYVYFVRAAGDTLISCMDDETFTVTYLGTNASGAPTYHVNGTLTAVQSVTGVYENLVLDFDFTVDIAFDVYYYYAYGQLVEITLCDSPVIITGDTIEVISTSLPFITYYSDYGLQTVEIAGATLDGTFVDGYILVEADSLEEGLYNLEGSMYLSDMTVMVGEDEYALNANEESTVAFTKSANGDTTYVEAYLAARDGNVYHFYSKFFTITEAGEAWIGQFQFDQTQGFYPGVLVSDKNLEKYGYFELFAYHVGLTQTDTTVIAIDFLVAVDDATLIGNYTLENLYQQTQYVEDAWNGGIIYILDATFSISDTDMDNIGDHFEGDFTCSDGYIHHITMDFTYTPTGLFNHAADVKVEKTIKNGQLIIRKNGQEFNVMGAKL